MTERVGVEQGRLTGSARDCQFARLYPTHASYVAAVERPTNENLKAGYITKDGAAYTIEQARQSTVGVNAR